MSVERRVVDNRTLLLGLDELFRESIKRHECTELLLCARAVAGALRIQPADVPVEGYYTEDPRLTEYFRLMRSLQAENGDRAPSVASLPEFKRLREVVSSPLFGGSAEQGKLLATGRDPLSEALHKTRPWTVLALCESAADVARELDDISLVGLAARLRDPVVLAAARESVVLYAEIMAGAALRPPTPVYVWEVDADFAEHAGRFVETVNRLFDEDVPAPHPQHAQRYWLACQRNEIVGRCVRLGFDPTVEGTPHYHWAIRRVRGRLEVHEFWAPELWTTNRYRAELESAWTRAIAGRGTNGKAPDNRT